MFSLPALQDILVLRYYAFNLRSTTLCTSHNKITKSWLGVEFTFTNLRAVWWHT